MNSIVIPILSIVIILNFIIGIVIVSRGLRDKINFLFGLIVLGISLWAFGILGFYLIKIQLDYLWIVETHSSAAFFAFVFVLFTFNFPRPLTKKFYIKILPLLPFFLILYYIFFTKDIIGNVHGINYEIGSGYMFYALYVMLYFLVGYIALFLQYKKSSDREQKIQIGYVLFGAILSSFLASISDLILPYFGIFEYNWLGPIFTFFLVGAIAYAILKHHLFNIKVIATELFTFAVWIVLLVRTLFSTGTQDIIINISLLSIVIFFGILLIRSVLNEVRQKEQIEQMAKKVEKAYEVEKKAHELEVEANKKLKELDKLKDDFLRQSQHDLRRPLAVLSGFSDLLLSGDFGKLPKKAKEVIEKMQEVVRQKVKDINSFLDIEQFKMGKGAVLLKPGVDLVAILQEIESTLSLGVKSKGIYLKLNKPENPVLINADREKLKAAIFNIVDNAVKFTEKGGVDVKIESNGSVVKIDVSDTGIGIPKDKIKNILNTQFERTEQAQKTAYGSGVGLYLSNQIINMHRGRVWIESEEGRGSTFHIEIPDK